MEVGLRYLVEKGFPPENEYISKAITSFLSKEPFDYNAYRIKEPKLPNTDYSYTAIGLYLYRSSVIIRAGYETLLPKNDFIDLKHDIDFSFATFTNVLNFARAEDAVESHRKKPCFKQDVLWPCIYHLRILAHSQGWRNKEKIPLLCESVNHLSALSHSGDDVYTYKKGQYISPCWAFIFMPILGGSIKDEVVSSSWFDIMELYARCGVVKQVVALINEYEALLALVDNDLTLNFGFNKTKNEFLWSPYHGIALEENWKTKHKLQCDLLFRILIIIHYAESYEY